MVRIGVLGTGQISSSLVTGWCTDLTSAEHLHFYLSPRNAQKAADLKAAYPEQVTVCASNQEVVDQSHWVILAVLPRDAEEILKPLHFRPEQKVLDLISDHTLATITSWIGPTQKLIRMVPLPLAALHIGPIATYPADEEIRELFQPLGRLVEVSNESELAVILTQTALMSPYFLLVREASQWGHEQGLEEKASLDYMASFFGALPMLVGQAKDNEELANLAYDTTPGGLNEMAYRSITQKGGYAIWRQALDDVMERLNKSK